MTREKKTDRLAGMWVIQWIVQYPAAARFEW